MPHFLISGTPENVSRVAAEVEGLGGTSVGVHDIAAVAAVAAGQSFDGGYIQLPHQFEVRGDTAVRRIQSLVEAILPRFPAVDAAVPTLGAGARITFVLGVLPGEVAVSDFLQARSALVRVLGHAAKADGADGLEVSVLDSTASAKEIALTAMGKHPEQAGHTEDDVEYADWRVELFGMMSADV